MKWITSASPIMAIILLRANCFPTCENPRIRPDGLGKMACNNQADFFCNNNIYLFYVNGVIQNHI